MLGGRVEMKNTDEGMDDIGSLKGIKRKLGNELRNI